VTATKLERAANILSWTGYAGALVLFIAYALGATASREAISACAIALTVNAAAWKWAAGRISGHLEQYRTMARDFMELASKAADEVTELRERLDAQRSVMTRRAK
jgi:hypothetical protein